MRIRTVLTMAAVAVLAIAGPAAGAPSAHAPAVPRSFHAQSLSMISTDQGWMLGTAPCGSNTCTTVLATRNGGATWRPVGTLPPALTLEDPSGVTEIRFADALHGWAFDPSLWVTNDGGATWSQQHPPGDRPVVALAGDAQAVYAVESACPFGFPLSNCKYRTVLWRTVPGQGGWAVVPVNLPVANQALLAVHGIVAYLDIPAALGPMGSPTGSDVLDVTVDGQTWTAMPDPCHPEGGETLTSIAPSSDTDVALLCQGNIGFGKAEKTVLRSTDNGLTTTPAGTMPLYGITTQLAAAPDGTLVAASYSIGTWIYRNAGGETWTTSVDLGDGGQGWNDVQFTSNETGFVIHGPAALCCLGHSGQLWVTNDAGLTWGPA